jgi:hypothetical protein
MNHRTHLVRDDDGNIEIHDGDVFFQCEDCAFEASAPINEYTGGVAHILNIGAGVYGIKHFWNIVPGLLPDEILAAHGVEPIPPGVFKSGRGEQ